MFNYFLRRILIDSGDEDTSKDYLKLLHDVLVSENATIEHLVVTHWHHDHIGGVNAVQNFLNTHYPETGLATVWKHSRSPDDPNGEDEEKSIDCWKLLTVRILRSLCINIFLLRYNN